MTTKRCRAESCERPAVESTLYCEAHIGQTRRCKAVRSVDGVKQRCKRGAMLGLDVCQKHGGQFPNPKKVHERSVAVTQMQRFVEPYSGDVDPIGVFEREFRRTLGRVEWLEEQIAALGDPNDLIWGKSKEEVINAGTGADFTPGTNTTYEAKINGFEEMLRWERKHLVEMEKVWIAAKLDERKLALMRSYVIEAKRGVMAALMAFGVDVSTPEAREIISAAFDPSPHATAALNAHLRELEAPTQL